jgi:hypothetical protein
LVERYRQQGVVITRRCIEPLSQVRRLVSKQPGKAMYLQPFVPPMRLEHAPGYNAIYRMYFGFDLVRLEWIPLHGVWMALASLIVHGTDKTMTGPLLSEI